MTLLRYEFTKKEKEALLSVADDHELDLLLKSRGADYFSRQDALHLAELIRPVNPFLYDLIMSHPDINETPIPALRCPNCNHEIHLGLPLVPSMVIEGVQYRIDHVESLPHPGQRDFVAEDSEHRVPIVFVAPI